MEPARHGLAGSFALTTAPFFRLSQKSLVFERKALFQICWIMHAKEIILARPPKPLSALF
jgi:hypothetical protein